MMSNNSTTKDDMHPASPRIPHLRSAGVSLILDLTDRIPSVLHWGRDLGELSEADLEALRLTAGTALLHNAPDAARRFGLLPGERHDWVGVPGLSGHRAGRATTPRPELTDVTVTGHAGHGGEIDLRFDDPVSELDIAQRIRLTGEGLVEVSVSLRSTASGEAPPYDLASLVAQLPLPARATEIPEDTREVCSQAWVLATVGVHPDHRGAGLGSSVIDAGLADLEESMASCTLQTSDERNVVFYERLGFAVTTVVEIPGGPTVWSMLRAS